MSSQHGFTLEEHPLPAVVLHWVHLVSFLLLAFTGIVIHYAPAAWPMSTIRTIHYVNMFVFVCTTVIRVYWAFFGAGSAGTGRTELVRDYKHFTLGPGSGTLMVEYLKYYLFIRKTRPAVDKYNPLQVLAYGYLFPLMILVMALTGFALYPPTAGAMSWFAALLGGLNAARLVHFISCFVMLSLLLVHLYLVVMEDPVEAYSMLLHYLPDDYRPTFARAGARPDPDGGQS